MKALAVLSSVGLVLAIALLLVLASMLLARPARAEILHKGKVVQTTADRIVAERQLVCSYAKPRFEALPDGRTVIINGKVCTEVDARTARGATR